MLLKKKTFIVYVATNRITGRRYIGATSCGLRERRNRHIYDAHSTRPGCRLFNRAIRKYGKDTFVWTILERCKNFDEMMKTEIKLIAKYKPEYNITKGGEGIVGVKRTRKWLNRVSKALKGRKLSLETIAKIKSATDYTKYYKPVVCLNDCRWFESVLAAAKYYRIKKRRISEVTCGRQDHVYGKFFVKSKTPLSKEICNKLLHRTRNQIAKRRSLRGRDKRRPVICLSNGRSYPSLTAAAERHKVGIVNIMQSCQYGIRSNGHYFRYADQTGFPKRKVLSPKEYQKRMERAWKLAGERSRKEVVVIQTGKIYKSIKEAADQLGIKRGALYAAVERGYRCCGLTVRVIDKQETNEAAAA